MDPGLILEHSDMQAIVRYAHRHMPRSCALILSIRNAGTFKKALSLLLPRIPNAGHEESRDKRPRSALHVAFTFDGMKALGVPQVTLDSFSEEFQEGMTDLDRARVLGDTGTSAPDGWDWGGRKTAPVHALLMLYGESDEHLRDIQQAVETAILNGDGAAVLARETTGVSDTQAEPFGFRDGIAQPKFQAAPTKDQREQGEVRAGEFVFGYLDEFDQVSMGPVLPPAYGRSGSGLPVADDSGNLHLGANGSYLVVRKLEQDVQGFWAFMASKAAQLSYPGGKEALAAKFVGRHRDGTPLVPLRHGQPAKASLTPKELDDFSYDSDKSGHQCPHAAHIRRSNPRDGLGENSALSITQTRSHRLLRRGRGYRQKGSDGRPPREGILFVALNCDIRRQFEFVQQTWINNPKFAGLDDTRDPLVGNNDGTGTMVIPNGPVRIKVDGIPRFVTVRAGGFFFLPGLRALRALL